MDRQRKYQQNDESSGIRDSVHVVVDTMTGLFLLVSVPLVIIGSILALLLEFIADPSFALAFWWVPIAIYLAMRWNKRYYAREIDKLTEDTHDDKK